MSIRQKSGPKNCPARKNRKKKDNADIAKKSWSSQTFKKQMQTGGMKNMKDE
jgi:hypothetical protein